MLRFCRAPVERVTGALTEEMNGNYSTLVAYMEKRYDDMRIALPARKQDGTRCGPISTRQLCLVSVCMCVCGGPGVCCCVSFSLPLFTDQRKEVYSCDCEGLLLALRSTRQIDRYEWTLVNVTWPKVVMLWFMGEELR